MIHFLPMVLLSLGHSVCKTYIPKIKDKIKGIQIDVITSLHQSFTSLFDFPKYLNLSVVDNLLLPFFGLETIAFFLFLACFFLLINISFTCLQVGQIKMQCVFWTIKYFIVQNTHETKLK